MVPRRELRLAAGLLQGSALAPPLLSAGSDPRDAAAHRDGGANNTRELRALAALALWAQQAGA